MENAQMPFPIVIMKEGDLFVALCPPLDIATQGKTEQEVKENMVDLIDDYLSDEDTPKPNIETIQAISLSYISIPGRYSKWENSGRLIRQK
ncbi:MAG: hypothetical protein WD876_03830 [Candidatus Pacearchaeota archaeon]